MSDNQIPAPDNPSESVPAVVLKNNDITCPVCGAAVVQEKCKVICRSDTCRGRVVMNCSEF
jgi:hypothetical protein